MRKVNIVFVIETQLKRRYLIKFWTNIAQIYCIKLIMNRKPQNSYYSDEKGKCYKNIQLDSTYG